LKAKRNTGNQHASRKADLMLDLSIARRALEAHDLFWARKMLATWKREHAKAPASTRRRWKCGR